MVLKDTKISLPQPQFSVESRGFAAIDIKRQWRSWQRRYANRRKATYLMLVSERERRIL